MTEETRDPLVLARQHFEKEDHRAALEAVNALLAQEQDHINAHQLRIEVLLVNFEEPRLLAESLNLLDTLAPEIYQTVFETVANTVYQLLSKLYDQILSCRNRQIIHQYLQTLDELAVLGHHFPTIYFTRGLAYQTALKLQSETTATPFEKLRDVLRLPSHNQHNPSNEKKTSDEDKQWHNTVIDSFTSAADGYDKDNPLRGEVYEILGTFQAEQGAMLEALVAYQLASDHGRDCSVLMEIIIDRLEEDAFTRILGHIDHALANRELETAEDLLTRFTPENQPVAWQVRQAELELYKGNLERAALLYDQLLHPEQPIDMED